MSCYSQANFKVSRSGTRAYAVQGAQQRRLCVRINHATFKNKTRYIRKQNCFCLVSLGNTNRRTTTLKAKERYAWHEEFAFEIITSTVVCIKVWDHDLWTDRYVGECEFDLEDAESECFTVDVPLEIRKFGKKPVPIGSMCITIELHGYGDANKKERLASNIKYVADVADDNYFGGSQYIGNESEFGEDFRNWTACRMSRQSGDEEILHRSVSMSMLMCPACGGCVEGSRPLANQHKCVCISV